MREITGNRTKAPLSDALGLPPYPFGRPFGELLHWHLKIHGTRPEGSRSHVGRKWLNTEFADAIGLKDDRMISRYLSNLNTPSNIEKICQVLFGNNQQYDTWRENLKSAAIELGWATDPKDRAANAKATPSVFVNLPPKTTNFISRKKELRWLANKLVSNVFRRSHSVAIIYSYGGVGKTSLSIEFGYENTKSFAGVWWCDAESQASLVACIGRIGDALRIKRQNENCSLLEAKHILTHLSLQKQSWLLIYDNVPDPKFIREFIPSGSVKILVTSRFSDWVDVGPSYPLENLSLKDSIRLLNQITDRSDLDGAKRLANKVGCLSLALNHAAIMCRRCRHTFDEYLSHVEINIRVNIKATDYEPSVFAVFESTMLHLGMETPACSLLMLLSFCGSSPIPTQLFEQFITTSPSGPAALITLSEISLVQFGSFYGGEKYVIVHKIIQNVVRIKAQEMELKTKKINDVCNAIDEILPAQFNLNPQSRYLLEILTPHVFEIFERDVSIFKAVASVPGMVRIGALYASILGMYGLADRIFEKCCDIYKIEFSDLNRLFHFELGNWQSLSIPAHHKTFKEMELSSDRIDKLLLYSTMLYDRGTNRTMNEFEEKCFEVLHILDVAICLLFLIRGAGCAEGCSLIRLTGTLLGSFNHDDKASERYGWARDLYASNNTVEDFIATDFALALVSVLFPDENDQLDVLQARFEVLTKNDAYIHYVDRFLLGDSSADKFVDELRKIPKLTGEILARQGKNFQAFKWFKISFKITQAIYGADHPNTAYIRSIVGVSLIRVGKIGWGGNICKRAIDDLYKMVGSGGHEYRFAKNYFFEVYREVSENYANSSQT